MLRVQATGRQGLFDCVVSIPPPASYQFLADTPAGWDFYDYLIGDIVKNNIVDWDDLNVIAAHWLNSGCGDADQWCAGADLDGSTGVDFVDYALLCQKLADAGRQKCPACRPFTEQHRMQVEQSLPIP